MRLACHNRSVLHSSRSVGVQQCVKSVNEIHLLSIDPFGHMPDAGKFNAAFAYFPCPFDLGGPVDVVFDCQAQFLQPTDIIVACAQRRTNESSTHFFALAPMAISSYLFTFE